ncbi:hypothetical protein [Bdellovibrio sp. HCB2-146]|uniref:hypothetical protein n=1 Tax=Bdellovibrio sp. HCB2-146 TaxID=3394362 RepID=UPI0039BC84F0
MKHILAGLILFASTQTFAAADSVAVFFSTKKTVVLVNEHSPNRIHAWMDQLGASNELHILSTDESIKIDCGRTATTASCTFRLLPSEQVQYGNKTVTAEMELTDTFGGSSSFEFHSSRGDQLTVTSYEGNISLKAKKAAQ